VSYTCKIMSPALRALAFFSLLTHSLRCGLLYGRQLRWLNSFLPCYFFHRMFFMQQSMATAMTKLIGKIVPGIHFIAGLDTNLF
jgi:hypothetical protein